MKKMCKSFLKDNFVIHPYDTNPDYIAKINYLYFSGDEKLIITYWEAPKGWFYHKCGDLDEVMYIIEGEIELISENETLKIENGDCCLLENKDKMKFNIKKFTKAFCVAYPVNEEHLKDIKEMIKN